LVLRAERLERANPSGLVLWVVAVGEGRIDIDHRLVVPARDDGADDVAFAATRDVVAIQVVLCDGFFRGGGRQIEHRDLRQWVVVRVRIISGVILGIGRHHARGGVDRTAVHPRVDDGLRAVDEHLERCALDLDRTIDAEILNGPRRHHREGRAVQQVQVVAVGLDDVGFVDAVHLRVRVRVVGRSAARSRRAARAGRRARGVVALGVVVAAPRRAVEHGVLDHLIDVRVHALQRVELQVRRDDGAVGRLLKDGRMDPGGRDPTGGFVGAAGHDRDRSDEEGRQEKARRVHVRVLSKDWANSGSGRSR